MHKYITIMLILNLSGCAIDDNQDGIVDQFEAFAHWDFEQLNRIFQSGEPHQEYKWTNIDTCYVFNTKATDYFEDPKQAILYQTCRAFIYTVTDPDGQKIGKGAGQACRNFATHRWEVL